MSIDDPDLKRLVRLAELAISRRRFLGVGAAVGGGVLGADLLAACGSASSTASSSQPFMVGVLRPLTGPLVSSFAQGFAGLDVAVEEINKSGGVMGRQIKLKIEDDQGDAAQEPVATSNLINAGMTYIVGPVGSSQALASQEISQRSKVIQSPQAADVSLTDVKKYPGAFNMTRRADQDVKAMCTYAISLGKGKRAAVMYENTAYGQDAGPLAETELKSGGLDVVTTEVYEPLASSYDANVARVQAANPDILVWYSSAIPDTIKIVVSMVQANFTPALIGSSGFLLNLNSDLPPGVTIPTSFLYSIRLPSAKTLLWEPGKKFSPRLTTYLHDIVASPDTGPNKFSASSGGFYDWMYVLKHAIETAKSFDYTKVKNALEATKNYQGVLGPVSFSKTNHQGVEDKNVGVGEVNALTSPESMGFLPMKPPQS